MCRETLAFAQQKWPGGTLYHYDLCELAQRQAVLMRKNKSPSRAIKSDRAKVVMTAGCISRNIAITNYIYNSRERGNSMNQNCSSFACSDLRQKKSRINT